MTSALPGAHGAPLERLARDDVERRWRRLELRVRLGLSPSGAACIGLWLHLGRELARQRAQPAVAMQLRLLKTLLQCAEDEALALPWRCACLDHAAWPLAEVRAWCRLHDPIAHDAIACGVQRAKERLHAAVAASRG